VAADPSIQGNELREFRSEKCIKLPEESKPELPKQSWTIDLKINREPLILVDSASQSPEGPTEVPEVEGPKHQSAQSPEVQKPETPEARRPRLSLSHPIQMDTRLDLGLWKESEGEKERFEFLIFLDPGDLKGS
jgi:hypothetical protein